MNQLFPREFVPLPDMDTFDTFTPGRASRPVPDEDAPGEYRLRLTTGAQHRAEVAAAVYDPNRCERAVYAGGHAGLSSGQRWPRLDNGELWEPADGEREADQLAIPLEVRLAAMGKSREEIEEIVRRQGRSSNSIADVLYAIEDHHLDPNRFNTAERRGLLVVAGRRHFLRFAEPLSMALDMDPRRIERVPMVDRYNTPAMGNFPPESHWRELFKERGALAFHILAMRGLVRGNVRSLAAAEQRFRRMVADPVRTLREDPVAMVRATLQALATG